MTGRVGGTVLVAALWAVGLAPPAARAEAEWLRETPGQRAYYGPEGQLRRVELDADGDGRFETEEIYEDGKRVSRREDRDGDGNWELRFQWQEDGTAVGVEDQSGGSLRTTHYAGDGSVTRVEEDVDRDGTAESTWIYEGGALVRVTRPEGRWIYRGGSLHRAELDSDRDGRVDRIETYGAGGKLARVEERTGGEGAQRVWDFGPGGDPLRVEEDLDGDGRREVTRHFRPGGEVERRVDANGDGRPEVLERYDAEGRLMSRREDLDGDGTFDLREGRAGQE